MSDLFPVSIDEMIAEASRELEMRRSVYPRRVADRKMTQATADRQIDRMTAIRDFLVRAKERAAG
jgi:hypothetical protein